MFFFLLKELFFLFITFIDYDGSTKEQFIKASGRVLRFFCKKFPFFNSQMHFLCCIAAAVITHTNFLLGGMFSGLTSSQ